MKNYIIPLTLYILYGGNKNKSFNNDMKTLFFHPPPSLSPSFTFNHSSSKNFIPIQVYTLYHIYLKGSGEREREKALERKWKK